MTTKLKSTGVEFNDGSLQTTAFREGAFALYYMYEDENGSLMLDTYSGGGTGTNSKSADIENPSILYFPTWSSLTVDASGQLVLTF